jgi:hypothetical protein
MAGGCAAASSPSDGSPTTSRCGYVPITCSTPARLTGWSSAIRMLRVMTGSAGRSARRIAARYGRPRIGRRAAQHTRAVRPAAIPRQPYRAGYRFPRSDLRRPLGRTLLGDLDPDPGFAVTQPYGSRGARVRNRVGQALLNDSLLARSPPPHGRPLAGQPRRRTWRPQRARLWCSADARPRREPRAPAWQAPPHSHAGPRLQRGPGAQP